MTVTKEKGRIGIFGGTFDPIHHGHLIIAQSALETFNLNKVIFIPAGVPPHKSTDVVTSSEHRFKMVQLAIQLHPHFQISDRELVQEGPSYTYHTLTYFQQLYPKADLYLIVGADSMMEINTWYRYKEWIAIPNILVMNRPGSSADQLQQRINHYQNAYGARIQLIHSPWLEIASSQLRKRAAEGKSLHYFVPETVAEYIVSHQLYKSRWCL